jgi:hypothetical protein
LVHSKKSIKKYYNSAIFSLLFFCQILYGQENIDKNLMTVEVFGHSQSLFSVNYERIFKLSPHLLYTLRTGIGYTPGLTIKDERHKGTLTIPFVFSLLAGTKKHYAQLGVGYTAAFGQDYIDSTTTTPTIHQKFESSYILSFGYRYMWNGFMGQAFPLLEWTNNPSSRFSVGFGVALGMTF